MIEVNCCDCGKPLLGIRPNRIARNPNRRCLDCHKKTFKGWSLTQGYVQVTVIPGRKGKRKLQHRLMAAELLGRPLSRLEVVHHRNKQRADNRFENFKIYPNPGTHVLEEGHVIRDSTGKFAKR